MGKSTFGVVVLNVADAGVVDVVVVGCPVFGGGKVEGSVDGCVVEVPVIVVVVLGPKTVVDVVVSVLVFTAICDQFLVSCLTSPPEVVVCAGSEEPVAIFGPRLTNPAELGSPDDLSLATVPKSFRD